jgi:hypothetical protein
MGLDQTLYAYHGKNKKETDFTYKDEDSTEEIYYWRKHPNLEEYMAELYFDKGGKGSKNGFGGEPCFNCCRVELKLHDIEDLIETIEQDKLPEGGGFFHGNDSDEYYKEKTLEALTKAKSILNCPSFDGKRKNKRIYYTSWW